jgi:hypothetical protein
MVWSHPLICIVGCHSQAAYPQEPPPLADPTMSSMDPSAARALTTSSLLSPTTGTTSSSLPGGFSGTGGDLGSVLQQLMMVMSMMLSLMMQLFQGGGQQSPQLAAQDAGSFDPNVQAPNSFTAVPPELSSQAPPSWTSGQSDTGSGSASPDPNQRLQDTLSKIAKDPDGAKLLAAAKANGYTIKVGDPNGAPGSHDASTCPYCRAMMDAGRQINGVTVPSTKTIIIDPNAPDFDKTVAHELVHAATESDGNSQKEEGMADVIGYRIASRIDGTALPGSERQIFLNKIANYPDLTTDDNGIIDDLKKLGIQA